MTATKAFVVFFIVIVALTVLAAIYATGSGLVTHSIVLPLALALLGGSVTAFWAGVEQWRRGGKRRIGSVLLYAVGTVLVLFLAWSAVTAR